MAYIHSIAKLFEIKDPNIVLEDKVDTLLVKEVTCKVIFGTLSYQPAACQNCGVVNRSSDDLIKFGYKTSRIKLTTLGLQPVLLMLKKQRFQCKHCQTTFMATTPLVDERCFISNTLKQMITLELAAIQAMTLIAKRLNISPPPVSTQLKKAAKALKPSKHTSRPREVCLFVFICLGLGFRTVSQYGINYIEYDVFDSWCLLQSNKFIKSCENFIILYVIQFSWRFVYRLAM